MADDSADGEHWVSPLEAVQLLAPKFPDASDAREAIINYAAFGMIAGRCKRLITEHLFGHQDSQDDVSIENTFWQAFTERENRAVENWSAAIFGARNVRVGIGPMLGVTERLLGVEMCKEDVLHAFGVPDAEPSPSEPRRQAPANPSRRPKKESMESNEKPFVTDAKLTAWLQTYEAQSPDAVHRIVKDAAQRKFPNSRIGKNQLYRAMKAVRGRIKRGHPAISR